MDHRPLPSRLTTARLHLRSWEPDDAAALHDLWAERDPRARRRVTTDGHPTVEELRQQLVDGLADSQATGLRTYAVQLADRGQLLGWCGLVVGRTGVAEPELAFEMFSHAQGRGFATEAARSVVAEADAGGRERLWATVWDWNAPSLRVLAGLGFADTGRRDPADPVRGTTVWWVRQRPPG